MQESKDIQRGEGSAGKGTGCGLMQESKDIQQHSLNASDQQVVV